jgi:hypothetical protein
VFRAVKDLNLDAPQLKDILDAEKLRVGMLPRDLSPYSFALQALLHSTIADFQKKFSRPKLRTSIVLQDGMEVPPWVETAARVIDLRSKGTP